MNKKNKWIVSNVECSICTHTWLAVYLESCNKIECPNCNLMVNYETLPFKKKNDNQDYKDYSGLL